MAISQTVTLDISTGAATVGSMIFMQRESEGRQLEFTVLNAGAAYTLTGFTDKIIVIEKPDGEIIYNNLTDVTRNTAKYTFTSQSQSVKGLLRCWLKFKLGGQIVVTPEFHIRVNEVVDFDAAVESTSEFGVLDSLIKDASDAVDEMDDMTASFENATASATTLAEGESATVSLTDGEAGKVFAFGIPKGDTGATGAKGDKGDKGDTGEAGGNIVNAAALPYTDTNNRLSGANDVQEALDNAGAQLAQNAYLKYKDFKPDFVRYIKDNQVIDSLYWKDGNGLNVVFHNDDQQIIHTFKKEAEDDFIKWDYARQGAFRASAVEALPLTSITRTGTWADGALPSLYTIVVGSTFSGTVKGSSLWFSHYRDNRGGIWRFVIDGDTVNYVEKSVWNSTSDYISTMIIDGLTLADHTIVATFMGADPLHAPTGGTARGWLYASTATTTPYATAGLYGQLTNVNAYDVLVAGANRDFVFNTTYNAVSAFIPSHSGVASVTKIDEPVYYVDDAVLDYAALGSYIHGTFAKIDIVQHFYGVIDTTNVAEFTHTTTIKSNGIVSFDCTLTLLQNVTAVNWYVGTLPAKRNVIDTIVTDHGNTKVNDEAGRYVFSEELDDCLSVCAVDSVHTSVIAAVTAKHPRYTLRQNEAKGTYENLWGNRNSYYFKIYMETAKAIALTSGLVYKFSTEYAIGIIPSVYASIMDIVADI